MRKSFSLFLYFFISLSLISSCTQSEITSDKLEDVSLHTRSGCDGSPQPIISDQDYFFDGSDCCVTLTLTRGFNGMEVELVGPTPSFSNPKEIVSSSQVTFCPIIEGTAYSIQIRDPNSSNPFAVIACAIFTSASSCE